MPLPHQNLDAVPFTPLTAEFLDNMNENIESLAEGSGFNDKVIKTNSMAAQDVPSMVKCHPNLNGQVFPANNTTVVALSQIKSHFGEIEATQNGIKIVVPGIYLLICAGSFGDVPNNKTYIHMNINDGSESGNVLHNLPWELIPSETFRGVTSSVVLQLEKDNVIFTEVRPAGQTRLSALGDAPRWSYLHMSATLLAKG